MAPLAEAPVRARVRHLDEHPLVTAVERRVDVVELLRVVQKELAKRAAELEFIYLNPKGRDLVEVGRGISREVRMLRRMADLVVAEHRVIGPPPLDHRDPRVGLLLALLLDRVVAVAHEVLPVEQAKAFELQLRQL